MTEIDMAAMQSRVACGFGLSCASSQRLLDALGSAEAQVEMETILRRRARREALEEAAKLAETWCDDEGNIGYNTNEACEQIAQKIRKRKA